MGKGNYDGYEYVKAHIVKAAVFGDDKSFDVIFNRYEGDIVNLIVARIRKYDLSVGYFPVEGLKHTVWIGLKDAVKKYRPK